MHPIGHLEVADAIQRILSLEECGGSDVISNYGLFVALNGTATDDESIQLGTISKIGVIGAIGTPCLINDYVLAYVAFKQIGEWIMAMHTDVGAIVGRKLAAVGFDGIVVGEHIPIGPLLDHHGVAEFPENVVFDFTQSGMHPNNGAIAAGVATGVTIGLVEITARYFDVRTDFGQKVRTDALKAFDSTDSTIVGEIGIDRKVDTGRSAIGSNDFYTLQSAVFNAIDDAHFRTQ